MIRLWLRVCAVLVVMSVSVLVITLGVGRSLPDPGQIMITPVGPFPAHLLVMDSQRGNIVPVIRHAFLMGVADPQVTTNGQYLAFEYFTDEGMKVSAFDRRMNLIYDTFSGHNNHFPSWSPNGEYLALWVSPSGYRRWNTALFHLWHVPTQTLQQVTYDLNNIPNASPMWSPDGRFVSLYYWNATKDGGLMSIYDIETNRLQNVTRSVHTARDPEWSPNGQYIMHQTYFNKHMQIFLYEVSTENIIHITQPLANAFDASWSPDGQTIALTTDQSGRLHSEIHVMNVEGTHAQQLTTSGGWDSSWSPDGRQITFLSGQEGARAYYIVSREGGEPRRLFLVDGNYGAYQFVGWYSNEN